MPVHVHAPPADVCARVGGACAWCTRTRACARVRACAHEGTARMHAHDARARLAARTPTRANPRARAQASLEGAGFTLEQLAAAGLSAVECVAAGWSKAEVASAGLAMLVGETLVCAVPGNRDGSAATVDGKRSDTSTEPFELPEGSALLSRAHPQFERIRTEGIAKRGWSANLVLVAKDEGGTGFASYRTANASGTAGTVWKEDSTDIKRLGDRRFRITNANYKLLIIL